MSKKMSYGVFAGSSNTEAHTAKILSYGAKCQIFSEYQGSCSSSRAVFNVLL